ncbi:hypothetical protein L917_08632 [Phytophthora nicotianae]|uniref:Uncharacterized protein n=1 Tax=Phytophthora nicotianae TaxID=4792 RepID=W2L6S8_PHYNI|nr:hypothetical protein L917_08632 [Phytophthora nicotianae]
MTSRSLSISTTRCQVPGSLTSRSGRESKTSFPIWIPSLTLSARYWTTMPSASTSSRRVVLNLLLRRARRPSRLFQTLPMVVMILHVVHLAVLTYCQRPNHAIRDCGVLQKHLRTGTAKKGAVLPANAIIDRKPRDGNSQNISAPNVLTIATAHPATTTISRGWILTIASATCQLS